MSEKNKSIIRTKKLEKTKAINKALTKGEKSGTPQAFDNDKFKARMRRNLSLNL